MRADVLQVAAKLSAIDTLLATPAVSLLNPVAWIDTVLVLGTIIGSRPDQSRVPFASGAVTASFVWFLGLTYGVRVCKVLFERDIAWRILDGTVALIMLSTAIRLAVGQLQ